MEGRGHSRSQHVHARGLRAHPPPPLSPWHRGPRRIPRCQLPAPDPAPGRPMFHGGRAPARARSAPHSMPTREQAKVGGGQDVLPPCERPAAQGGRAAPSALSWAQNTTPAAPGSQGTLRARRARSFLSPRAPARGGLRRRGPGLGRGQQGMEFGPELDPGFVLPPSATAVTAEAPAHSQGNGATVAPGTEGRQDIVAEAQDVVEPQRHVLLVGDAHLVHERLRARRCGLSRLRAGTAAGSAARVLASAGVTPAGAGPAPWVPRAAEDAASGGGGAATGQQGPSPSPPGTGRRPPSQPSCYT